MAIAFDATANTNGGGGSFTFSHTCASSANMMLLLSIAVNGGTVTAATYNGVAMTLATSVTNTFTGYLYYLANPASGAHTISVTCSGSLSLAVSASYSGVKGQAPEATNTKTGNGSTTQTITPTTNKSWGFLAGFDSGSGIGAGTGITSRGNNNSAVILGDTNGAITPPASTTLGMSASASNNGFVLATFAPAPTALPLSETQATVDTYASVKLITKSFSDTVLTPTDSFVDRTMKFGTNTQKTSTTWTNTPKT